MPIGLGTTVLNYFNKIIGNPLGIANANNILITDSTGKVTTSNFFAATTGGQLAAIAYSFRGFASPTLGAGFIISSLTPQVIQATSSAGAISSNALTPIIAPGASGVGLQLYIFNSTAIGSGNIFTFKAGGNVALPGNVDFALTPQSFIAVYANSATHWSTMFASVNS